VLRVLLVKLAQLVKEVIQGLLAHQVNKASQVLQEKKVLRYDVALGNKLQGPDSLTFQIIMQTAQDQNIQ